MSGPCGRVDFETNKGLPAPNLEGFSLLETFSSRRRETVGKYTRSTQVVDYSKQGQTKQFTLLYPLSMKVGLSFTHFPFAAATMSHLPSVLPPLLPNWVGCKK